MVRPALALSLAMFFCLGVVAAKADGDDQQRITVIGRGEARAVPDVAVMSIGVETEAKTPSEALAANAVRMTAIMATFKESGIQENDLQTSQLGIWPIYADQQQPRRTIAYRVTNQVTVTLREIDRLGEVLDRAVGDGANAVNGPTFSVAEQEPLLRAARDAAVKDAIDKAERYADAAGVTLGKILSIVEGGGGPVFARQMRAEAMTASTPVAAGETTFSADVTMMFEID